MKSEVAKNNLPLKKINNGIEILRLLLIFLVVFAHFGNPIQYGNFFVFIVSLAVPSFMMISFYLLAPSLLEKKNIEKEFILKRLNRLLVPFWGWGIISFLIMSSFNSLPSEILLQQLLAGHTVNTPLYFLFVQIVIFLFVALIKKTTNLNIPGLLLIISTIFLILQYSEINFAIFSKLSRAYSFPLGRLAELVPAATLGILLKKFSNQIEGSIKTKKEIVICFAILFLAGYMADKIEMRGFGYQGLGKLIGSFALVTAFVLIGLTRQYCERITKISSLTLGVFCSHLIIGNLIFSLLYQSQSNTVNVLLALTASFLLSFAISLIPFRLAKQLVQ